MGRAKKLRIYAKKGVDHAWLVDPIAQTLEVLHLEAGRLVIAATHADAQVARAEPFEALEIRLGQLWDVEGGPLAPHDEHSGSS